MSSVTVRAGDSMWAIAQRAGVSLQELIRANPHVANPGVIFPGQVLNLPGANDDFEVPAPPPIASAPPAPATPPTSGTGSYAVKPGDSMWGIASRHGVSLSALIAANPQVRDPNVLRVGDVLHLPGGAPSPAPAPTPAPGPTPAAPSEYVVRTGDSMSGIAQRAGVSLAELLRANPDVRNPALIYPGQRLVIPPGGQVPQAPAPVAPSPSAPAGNNPYLAEFTRAAQTAGVPEAWATNAALLQLVRHESGFRPGVKNPSSSAFGLFQFLDSTWRSYLPEVPYGSTDPYWQAVGGFRYIQQRYGTPERAWAFWQATVNRDVSLAPADLRGLAQHWIDRRYAGY